MKRILFDLLRSGLQRLKSIPPPNLPRLAGIGCGLLGILLLIKSLLSPWWTVPVGFDGTGQILLEGSSEEPVFKILLAAAAVLWIGVALLRPKWKQRWGKTCALVAFTWLFGSLLFAHQLIVAGGEKVDLAMALSSEFDELTWLGGDIYTAREYEYLGGGENLYLKDPPLILSRVPPPHGEVDIAAFGDHLRWLGMSPTLWNFLRKGWPLGLLGSSFLLIGALSLKPRGAGRGLTGPLPGWVLTRLALGFVLLFALVSIRASGTASALQTARSEAEQGDLPRALAGLNRAEKWMPAMASDSGLVMQRGLWELRLAQQNAAPISPHALLYEASLAEQRGQSQNARYRYREIFVAESFPPAVRAEAQRGLLRNAINAYNSGQLSSARQLFEIVFEASPTLPKTRYARFLIALREGQREEAAAHCEALAAILGAIQKPEGRATLSSARAHLAQMAIDAGDPQAAWLSYHQKLRGK